jgi:hypothetical protein
MSKFIYQIAHHMYQMVYHVYQTDNNLYQMDASRLTILARLLHIMEPAYNISQISSYHGDVLQFLGVVEL